MVAAWLSDLTCALQNQYPEDENFGLLSKLMYLGSVSGLCVLAKC